MLKSIYKTTTSANEEIIPKVDGGKSYAIKNLTMAVSQDTNIYINNDDEPVIILAQYGLSMPNNVMVINSLKVEKSGTNVYCLFYY